MNDIDIVLGMLNDLTDEELDRVIKRIHDIRTQVLPPTTGTLTITKL